MSDMIEAAVERLGAAFGKTKMPPEMVQTWAQRLAPHGPLALRVLRDAVTWEHWPTLGVILGKVHAEAASLKQNKLAAPVSGRERAKADESAILSIVWLHMVKRWQPRDFAGTIFARQMGRTEHEQGEFLRQAASLWTVERIQEWMDASLAKASKDEERERIPVVP